MKIAIAADWLPTYGGAEHVLASLVREWPTASLHTTIAAPKKLGPLASHELRTDLLLQWLYRTLGRHEIMLPWMPRAIERMRFEGYDVVVSSSHAVGKGVIVPPTAVHVCYCHTPMRYAWEMEEQYLKDFGLKGYLKKKVQYALKKLRRWDLSTAKRVDSFIANSSETRARILRIYGRESVVIPPPVEDRFFHTPLQENNAGVTGEKSHIGSHASNSSSYFLALGRLVPYKRFDLLLEIADRMKLPLKIAGTGRELQKLQERAGSTVEFLGFVPDAELPSLYAGASALLFPQMEDAGIVPMEAQASGVPVIAYGAGGVLDVVVHGKTGVLASAQTVDSFLEAMTLFQSISWDRPAIRKHAEQFHESIFRRRMAEEVERVYEHYAFPPREA